MMPKPSPKPPTAPQPAAGASNPVKPSQTQSNQFFIKPRVILPQLGSTGWIRTGVSNNDFAAPLPAASAASASDWGKLEA
jgi:hypothetical protein